MMGDENYLPYVSVGTLAELLNLPCAWLCEAARLGVIPYIELDPCRRFDVAEVRKALASNATQRAKRRLYDSFKEDEYAKTKTKNEPMG